MIPILQVREIGETVDFLTRILDFDCAMRWPDDGSVYAVMMRGGEELHLQRLHPESTMGRGAVIVLCDEVDERWAAFRARGLAVPDRPESPVHQGPLDQTWGSREVYIDDPNGNTIIFQQRR